MLVLQKPHSRSKVKEHNVAIERRLKLWLDGSFETLFKEGLTIQKQFHRQRQRNL